MDNLSCRVLLVEDNEDDYLILRDLLWDIATTAFDLQWVDTYQAAREALSRHRYDVCLLDQRLGEATGVDLVREFAGSDTPFILLTGNEDYEVDVAATKAGASDYLLKGHINAPILERSIRYAIQHKNSEAALQQAQRFAQATVDALPGTIAVVDEHGTIVAVNAAWRAMAQHNNLASATDSVGANYLAVCDSSKVQDGRAVASGIRAVMAGEQQVFRREYPCHSPREERWFEVRVTRFSGSEPLHVVVAHENITERRLAEARIQASEAGLAAAQHIARLGSWEWDLTATEDPSLNPVRWSDEAYRIFGYTPGEIEATYDAFVRVLHPDDVPLIQAMAAQALRDGTCCSHDHRLIRPDGSERIVHQQSEVLFDARSGRALKMVGTVQDITERKRDEERLAASEMRYRRLFESAQDGILILDAETGRIVDANPYLEERLGYSLDELLGKKLWEIGLFRDIAANEDAFRDLQEVGYVRYENLPLKTKAGQSIAVEFVSNVYDVDGGKVVQCNIRDITERQQAENALRASEERFQSIVANVPGMVYQFVLGPDGSSQWPFVSEGCRDIYEVEPEVLQNNPTWHLERIHPDDLSTFDRSMEASARTLSPWRWEGRQHLDSGKIKWIQGASRPRRLPDGGTQWDGLVMDISARKEAEEERDRFFTMSLDMLGIAGLDGYFKRLNPAFSQTLGYDEADMLARPFMDWVHPEDKAATQEAVSKLSQGNLLVGFENRQQCKDGSWRWLEWKAVAAVEAGVIYAAARDITARKEAEAALLRMRDELEVRVQERTMELARANEALQIQIAEREEAEGQTRARARQQEAVAELGRRALSNTDLHLLLQGAVSLSAAVLNVDHGVLAEWLPDTREARIRAAIGQPNYPLQLQVAVAPGSLTEFVLRSGVPVIMDDSLTETRFEVSPLMREQGIRSIIAVTIQVGDQLSGTQPYGAMAVGSRVERAFGQDDASFLQSVSNILATAIEQRRIQEVAHRARQEAEQANMAKSEFLSRMSHELRTPLNAILGFGQILEMRAIDPKQTESILQILKAGRHLLSLINEVLDIARIEAGHMSLSLEPIPAGLIVREVLGLVQPLAATRNIRLVNEMQNGAGGQEVEKHLLADQQRLKQVLLNLLSNAVKYNREGGEVSVSCEVTRCSPVLRGRFQHEGQLRFLVRDTGAGLSHGDIAKLFMPFERLGAARSQIEGTGIGLTLCKRLVEAMEGQIGVESEVGQGSTFWVQLPLVRSPLEQATGLANGHATTPDAVSAERLGTILYIEDNLSLIEQALAQQNYRVKFLTAMQGSVGLELAAQHTPNLILLDMHLPDIMGDAVLRRLKADASTRHIPVVVLSADATPSQVERLLAGGAQAYLTKPLDLKQFFNVMEQVLQGTQGTNP